MICRVCGSDKPETDFVPDSVRAQGRRRDCRKCYSAAHTRWNRTYKLRKFGLTEESFAALLSAQGGGCAICGSRHPGNRHDGLRFHMDHDHATGKFRGLLCQKCNRALGFFNDEPERLIQAAAYLRKERS